jgi:quinol monooxygenase YgiN
MATHGHMARFEIQPGRRKEAIDVLRPMFDQVEKEPGTLLYMMHICPQETDVIWFYEQYQDEAAFTAHTSSATHHNVIEKLKPLLSGEVDVVYLELVAAKGGLRSASMP